MKQFEQETAWCRWCYNLLGEMGTGYTATYSKSNGLELWTRSGQRLTLDAPHCTPTIVANVLYFAGFGGDALLRTILATCSVLSVERSADIGDTSPPSYAHY